MNINTINEYLLELVQETSKELLIIYFNKPNRRTLLKFPKYRNGEIRISEQEFRFVMTNLHGQFSYPTLFYSVETPTVEEYGFSENGKRSASSDLSFYYGDEKVMNIELKAHNPEQSAINKDIEKLTNEDCNGAWVHLLKNEDKGTVKTLFKKFEEAFENAFKKRKIQESKKPISFHILILESKTLLSRKGKENVKNYSNIFNLEYESWEKLRDKPGKYLFYNGNNLVDKDPLKADWQIDIFDI